MVLSGRVTFLLSLQALLFIASDLILKPLVLGDPLGGLPSHIGFCLFQAFAGHGQFGHLLSEAFLQEIAILLELGAMLFEVINPVLQLLVVGLKAQHVVSGTRLRLFAFRTQVRNAFGALLMRRFQCLKLLLSFGVFFQQTFSVLLQFSDLILQLLVVGLKALYFVADFDLSLFVRRLELPNCTGILMMCGCHRPQPLFQIGGLLQQTLSVLFDVTQLRCELSVVRFEVGDLLLSVGCCLYLFRPRLLPLGLSVAQFGGLRLQTGLVLFQFGYLFPQLLGLGFQTGDSGLRRGLAMAVRFICLNQTLLSVPQLPLMLLQSCLEFGVLLLRPLMLSVDTADLGFQGIDAMFKFRDQLLAFGL